jgi:hypothetical protein
VSFLISITSDVSLLLALITRTLDFTAPVLMTIFLGLFAAGLLMETGVLRHFSALARPIVSVAHLPEICASSFAVSIGSTVAANGMISRFREDGALKDREVFLCTSVNSIPAYIREIFTYQIPVVIPALGIIAGSVYTFIFIVTALVKISLVIILGRTFLEERSYDLSWLGEAHKLPLTEALTTAFKTQIRIFARIGVAYFLMTLLVFALKDMGVFDALSVLPLSDLFGIPSESMVPLTSYVASPILGLSMLGPMIHSGSISEIQAMIVLMLGSMFMLPVFAMRSMVPNYTALFGLRLGLSVVAFSTGISILVRFIFLLAFLRIA